jgi:hypothetical protein
MRQALSLIARKIQELWRGTIEAELGDAGCDLSYLSV